MHEVLLRWRLWAHGSSSICTEVNLYETVGEQDRAVERRVTEFRSQLLAVRDQIADLFAKHRPAAHSSTPSNVVSKLWCGYLNAKYTALYAKFCDALSRLQSYQRNRRRRMILLAQPDISDAQLSRRLDAEDFEVFASAVLSAPLNSLSPWPTGG